MKILNLSPFGYQSAIRWCCAVLLLAMLACLPTTLIAEGSVDFVNYPGYRLFFNAEQQQQLKVYANAGEFINVGASHVGISGGSIAVYAPDGTLYAVFDNNSSTEHEAIIMNHLQEQGGPTGGGTTNGPGYVPGVVEVPQGMPGVWTVKLEFPEYSTSSFLVYLKNDDPWNRADHQPLIQRAICSWDITVSQNNAGNNGGILLEGRVFANEYISIVDNLILPTSPTFYVLNKDGFIYDVSFSDTQPWGFPIFSNTWGVTTGDGQPTYASHPDSCIIRSADPDSWELDNKYIYDPQAEDTENIINNKLFFNIPDANLPATALVTDLKHNNTHTTWLYKIPPPPFVELSGGAFIAILPEEYDGVADILISESGGHIIFNANYQGTFILDMDLNENGIFDDPEDRRIYKRTEGGLDSIFWDGKNGLDAFLEPQEDFVLKFKIKLIAGEIHILLADIENNTGGIRFTRINGEDAPQNYFSYNHTGVGGEVSGGTVLYPDTTSIPHTYDNDWGNEKILDYWTYVGFQSIEAEAIFDIYGDADDLPDDADNDGVFNDDDIDDDNDGIPDLAETCQACSPPAPDFDPGKDHDFDGVPNYQDADLPGMICADENNDGICDAIMHALDKDQDGVPNFLDLDADNDGIPDVVEAGHYAPDLDGNGRIDGVANDFGENGFYNLIASDPDDFSAVPVYTIFDFDEDAFEDFLDLNTDADGINDVLEAGHGQFDLNEDGMLDADIVSPPLVGENGIYILIDPELTGTPLALPPDNDMDGSGNWRDLDSDNDGIKDAVECGFPDDDNDGFSGSGVQLVNHSGQEQSDAFGNLLHTLTVFDTDGDNVPNYLDLDSDNDGIHDVMEGGGIDPDNDAILGAGIPVVNLFGLPETDAYNNSIPQTPELVDTDNDGLMDAWDLDADNDGIDDVLEVFFPDPDNEGVIGFGIPFVNDYGIPVTDILENVFAPTSFPIDNDSDGVPTFQDLDADNDGINDVLEAGYVDPDLDGIAGEGIPVVNEKGQPIADGNNVPILTDAPPDTDNDLVPEWVDLDVDNDGLNDVAENYLSDPDNDGIIGIGIPVVNSTGQPVADEENNILSVGNTLLDCDEDGQPNQQDSDCDNDNIPDTIENGFEDLDFDGVVGTGMPVVNIFGQPEKDELGNVLVTTSDPGNNDDDSTPNFTDTDSDNDGIPDEEECPDVTACPNDDGDDWPDFLDDVCDAIMLQPALSGQTAFCIGESISLSVGADASWTEVGTYTPVEYRWYNGENILLESGEDLTTLDIPASDPMAVSPFTLQVIRGSCLSEISIPFELVVNQVPGNIAASTSPPVCAGGDGQLFTDGVEGATYVWKISGSPDVFSTEQNPEVNALESTTDFEVTMTLPGCEPVVSSVTFIVNELPQINPNAQYDLDEGCQTSELNLLSNANQADLFTYQWSGPNGFSSTLENPVIVNAGVSYNGVYNLEVTNAAGCTAQSNIVVTNIVDGILAPEIQVNNSLCEGTELVLTIPAYDEPDVLYSWTTPFGNFSGNDLPQLVIDELNPVAHSGVYSVMVETGNCTIQSETYELSVPQNPDFNPQVFQEVNCHGEAMQLLANETGVLESYSWYGPNGFYSEEINPLIPATSFLNNGIYTLMVTTQHGCTITKTLEVNSIAVDFPEPVLLENENTCAGTTFAIVAEGYENVDAAFNWITPEGISGVSGLETAELVFESLDATMHNGIYQLEVVVDGCHKVSNAVTLAISNNVIASPDILTSGTLCEGENFTLVANAINAVSFQWTGPGGFSSNAENPELANVQVSENGIYTLEVFDENDCTASYELLVNNIVPAPALPVVSGEHFICADENIALSVQEYTVGEISYSWQNASGVEISTEAVLNLPANSPLAISPFEVVVIADGCTSGTSFPYTVFVAENQVLSVETPVTVCAGENTFLTANTIPGANYTWESVGVDPPIVAYGEAVIIPNLSQTTDFVLTVENATCLQNTQATITAPVSQIPEINLMVENGNACTGEDVLLSAENLQAQPGQILEYSWEGPNGFNYTGTDLSAGNFELWLHDVTALDNGLYTLHLNSTEGCAAIPQSILIEVGESLPAPEIEINVTNICVGESFLLTCNTVVSNEATYEWYLDDGGSPGQLLGTSAVPYFSTMATTANEGIYYLIVKTTGCESLPSNPVVLAVNDVPEDFIAQNSTEENGAACIGDEVQLSASFVPGAIYEWSGPDGFSSSLYNPVLTIDNIIDEGVYNLVVTIPECADLDIAIATTVELEATPPVAILSSAGDFCEGSTATISISNQLEMDTGFLFYWYKMPAYELLEITSDPVYTIDSTTISDSGAYSVMVQGENCNAELSSPVLLQVINTADVVASAGTDQTVCNDSTIFLAANLPASVSGTWYAGGAALVAETTDPNTAVNNLEEGTNEFVWVLSTEACGAFSSDTVTVFKNPVPEETAFAGDDFSTCNGSEVVLNAQETMMATGQWVQSEAQSQQGVYIVDPAAPGTAIEGMQPGQIYNFEWQLSTEECLAYSKDKVSVIITAVPDVEATVIDTEIQHCDSDALFLKAIRPEGLTGKWTTNSGAVILNPENEVTMIEGLSPGDHIFTWSLSKPGCGEFSSATVTVNYYDAFALEAEPDNFIMPIDEVLKVANILENDVIESGQVYEIEIIRAPEFGILEIDGTGFTYTHTGDLSSKDDNFIYQICDPLCKEICSMAMVQIKIVKPLTPEDCFFPNTITPNEDGLNDVFEINCLEDFPENEMEIFNRWGRRVFAANPYQNDFDGKYKNEDLPAGTYFYVVKLNDEANTAYQGFFTLVR